MKRPLLLTSLLFAMTFSCIALPKTIMIFRHSEGYYVPAKKAEMGPCLSKEGYYRTYSFFKYYLDVIVKEKAIPFPDYIFAPSPYDKHAKYNMASSVRHIQTLAPLVTWMYEHRPDTTKDDLLLIPYRASECSKMAKLLVHADYLDNKTVLICWTHDYIADIINSISKFSGYKLRPDADFEKWKGNDFGSIVFLTFDKEKKTIDCDEISNAYNVPKTEEEKQALEKWFFSQFIQ